MNGQGRDWLDFEMGWETASDRDLEATYRLVWSWSVRDPFDYSRQLNKAWIRRKLPVKRLLVSAVVTGQIAVTIEVSARNTAAALARWADFAIRAVRDQRLEHPRALTLSIAELEKGRYHPGDIGPRWSPPD
jgi:hypothetical protein